MAALTLTVTDRTGLKDARNGWAEGWGVAWGGTPEVTVEKVATPAEDHVRSATDRMTLEDTTGRGLVRSFADAAGVGDASLVRLGSTIRLTATDTAGAGDPVGTAAGRSRSGTSQLPLADSSSRTAEFARTLTDGSGLVDALQRVGQRTVTDGVGLSEVVMVERMLLRSADDRLAVTDFGFVGAGSLRTLPDVVGLTDTLTVRAVALDVPGEATLLTVPAATAVLVVPLVGTAVLVLAEFGVGTAVVAGQDIGAATIRQDTSSGGTATITSTRRS